MPAPPVECYREVRGPGPVPLRGGRVVAVVAGQVQVAQVHGRVAPVQLQVAELDPGRVGERGQLGLVVRVGQRRVGAAGVVQLGQAGPDPGPREVLDPAVVLVPAAALADLGHMKIADGTQPRSQVIHARHRTGPGTNAGAGPSARRPLYRDPGYGMPTPGTIGPKTSTRLP